MSSFQTSAEENAGRAVARIFDSSPDPTETKLANFPKYVRWQHLKRFLALYELFKMVLPVKGSIVECGVFRGFGLMAWAKLSAMLEPENLTRRIYGFDSFDGFPAVGARDANHTARHAAGDMRAESHEELLSLIAQFDEDRFLGHIEKVRLIRGNIVESIPAFLADEPHLVVSLLFLDADLYEPSCAALEHLLPRMPKGAVVAFDELDNPQWPGETLAALDRVGFRNLRLRRFEWDPYIAYAEIE